MYKDDLLCPERRRFEATTPGTRRAPRPGTTETITALTPDQAATSSATRRTTRDHLAMPDFDAAVEASSALVAVGPHWAHATEPPPRRPMDAATTGATGRTGGSAGADLGRAPPPRSAGAAPNNSRRTGR